MDENFVDEISKLDWKVLGRKLLSVSIFWVEHTFKDPQARLPKGYTHDDVVQDAIQRSLKHKWEGDFDKTKYIKFLFGAIRSIISNLAKSADNKKTIITVLFNEDDEDEKASSLERFAVVEEDFDYEIDHDGIMETLDAKIQGNSDLEEVLTAIKLGMEPMQIADELKKDVKEVYKLKRQLFGIVDKIAKTH